MPEHVPPPLFGRRARYQLGHNGSGAAPGVELEAEAVTRHRKTPWHIVPGYGSLSVTIALLLPQPQDPACSSLRGLSPPWLSRRTSCCPVPWGDHGACRATKPGPCCGQPLLQQEPPQAPGADAPRVLQGDAGSPPRVLLGGGGNGLGLCAGAALQRGESSHCPPQLRRSPRACPRGSGPARGASAPAAPLPARDTVRSSPFPGHPAPKPPHGPRPRPPGQRGCPQSTGSAPG